MRELDSATITVFGKPFRVFGHPDDGWYQSVKSAGRYNTRCKKSKLVCPAIVTVVTISNGVCGARIDG